MKPLLMLKDRDFDLYRKLPPSEEAITQDLELNTLLDAMSLGDKFLFDTNRKAVLSGLENDLITITYRQNILKDCLNNPAAIRMIYSIAVESIENEKKHYLGLFRSPGSILFRSIEVLQMFVGALKKLKNAADEFSERFESDGFNVFFAMIKKELSKEYFTTVQKHLNELKFKDGLLMSAELGKGNKGKNYILRKSQRKKDGFFGRIFSNRRTAYTFCIHERDESGSRALSELKDRGINSVANALAQSADHILHFFNMLRAELAFYVGCLNLYEKIVRIGGAVTFPLPVGPGERRHDFRGLYDVCLALTLQQRIVGNELCADHKTAFVITGANQGGKSTFLRSIGLSQLMMQCGMFVPAESFISNICDGLFTHFKREEDTTMKSGKLDEELSRMSAIADHLTPSALVLFNESFAATNEREGSEIARQITSALLENRIKFFYVTHLTEFACSFYAKKNESCVFLRAERESDGKRTYKIIEGEPLQTSYGEDLYYQIVEPSPSNPS